MRVKGEDLSADMSALLDNVIETGEPVEIERKGCVLRIEPVGKCGRIERLPRRPEFIKVDPEELIHLDWSGLWSP